MQDSEHFAILLTESLVNAYSIIQSPLFQLSYAENIAKEKLSIEDYLNTYYYEILYSHHMIIEESYNNILPLLFSNIPIVIDTFINYSKQTKKKVQLFILLYIMCSIFILLIYYIFILFTNNHLGEGIEKVVKISQDKIDDMIKQIMTFKSLYRKKLSKLYQIEQDNKKKKEEEIGKTVIFKNEDKLVVKNKSNNLL